MSDTDPARRHPLLNAAFFVVLGVMLLHEAEHVAQVVQKDIRNAPCPNDCRGLLGFAFDLEWVHFVYNTSIWLALTGLYLAYRMWRPEWRQASRTGWVSITAAVLVAQAYHVVEHTVKLVQWFQNGHRSPTIGILGGSFSLIELHFTLNTIVLVGVLAGWFLLGFHRAVWPRTARPAWVAATAVLALLVAGGAAAWTQRPETVHLAARVYQGPIVLDHAMRLVGKPGTIVRGGIKVTASDVIVRNLAVEGGVNGIEVDGAKAVLLQKVSVSGAQIDGIHVRRASVVIRGCRIDSGENPWAQAIDISFSYDYAPSAVKGCTITGGREGIVSHSSQVMVRGNVVRGTSLRGIDVTEMSMGEVSGNKVHDALGVGIFCGDRSMCHIEGNLVTGTRPDAASQDLSRMGYAVQIDFESEATVLENRLHGNPFGVGTFAGARLEPG